MTTLAVQLTIRSVNLTTPSAESPVQAICTVLTVKSDHVVSWHDHADQFVCTPMDKAMDTLVFQCPKVYINDIMHDLQTGGTYENVDGHSEAWKHIAQSFSSRFSLTLPPFTDTSTGGILDRHALLKGLFGIKTDVGSQSIPLYRLTRKMHKDSIGARIHSQF